MGNIDMEIDLPVAKVIGSKKDSFGNIIIAIETTEMAIACKNCGRSITNRAGSDAACKVKHVPVFGVETFIIYKPHKYICGHCQGKPITIATLLPHISNLQQRELSHAC